MKKRKYFRITFSCSEDELRAIRQTAADCGMSMSMYCKKVVLGFKPKYAHGRAGEGHQQTKDCAL